MYQKILVGPDPGPSNRLQAGFRSAAGVLALLMLPPALLLLVTPASPADPHWQGLILGLAALAVALQAQPRPAHASAVLGRVFAALAAAMALGALAGRAASAGTAGPAWLPLLAWPGPAFLLLGCASALFAAGLAVRVAQACALALLYLASAHLLAIGTAAPAWPDALGTSPGLLAGAAALLCLRAGEGLLDNLTRPGSAGVLERRLLPVAAGFPLLVGWLRSRAGTAAPLTEPVLETVVALASMAALVAALRYTGRVLSTTEAQVWGERERLRQLLLAHGHGLLLVERSGRIALANPAMADMLGTRLEALLGHPLEAVLPGLAAGIEDDFRAVRAVEPPGARARPRESLARSRSGADIPVEASIVPLQLEGSDYLLVTVVDMRERERLAQLQKSQEAQLKLFIRYAPVAIAMLDHELRYIAASERWLLDFGLGQQTLAGRHHFEVFPQLSATERDRINFALQGQVDRQESLRFPRRDGGVDWFRWEIRPWRDDRQEIGGVLMFAELITAQVAAESALQRMRKETERLLRGQVDELQALNSEIVRTARSGLLVYRASGLCLLANEAAARMVGSSVDQLLSEDFRGIPSWRRLGLLDAALDALARAETVERQVDYPLPGAQIRQIAFTFSSVAAGSTPYLVVHAQDISSYIATQRELRAAGEAARQANDAKSMFIANMSHEIRTPMHAVLGLAYLLESDESLGPEARDAARKIRDAGRGLMGIVDDILDLSKIEAGQLRLERIPFRLGEVFARVGSLLAGAGRGQDNELILSEPPADADALIGDPLRVQQVLLNLGGNALKFTRGGEVEIAAEVLERGLERIRLRLSVRDTGIGIAPELQEHIFQPFSQADSSTARRFGGSGLGLTICRKIVSALGGTLGVQSAPGQGSTFWCELDFARDPQALPAIAPAVRRPALVVDGRGATRHALSQLLARLGWQAEAVGSTARAFERISRQSPGSRFELVLIDSQLDGASELARSLRRLQDDSRPCRVLMLDPMGPGGTRTAVSPEVDAVLSKPVDSLQLAATLARLAEAPAAAGAPDETAQSADRPLVRAQTLSGLRVLVVDDSATNREVAARILERFGARPTLADCGAQALAQLQLRPLPFDAVLMDIQMPELDGLEATRRLRRMRGLEALPVIALSGGAMVDQIGQARDAGMNDFLAKPFEARALVDVLRHWCAGPLPARRLDTAADGRPAGLDGLLQEFGGLGAQLREDLAAGAPRRASARLLRLRAAAARLEGGLPGAEALARLAGGLEHRLQRSIGDPAAEQSWDALLQDIGAIDVALRSLAMLARAQAGAGGSAVLSAPQPLSSPSPPG